MLQQQERRITDNTNNIRAIIEWQESIKESVAVNKRMVEVGESLIEALGWLGSAAKWVCQFAAAVGALWAAVKSIIWLGNNT